MSDTVKNKDGDELLSYSNICVAQNIDMLINKLVRNDEEIDVTEFGIMQGSMNHSSEGDLLFYAYKELKRLRDRVEKLEKGNE